MEDNDLIVARAGVLEASTPGAESERRIQGEETALKKVESDKLADDQWRNANYQAPYEYRDAFANGVDLTKGKLPNKYITRGSVNIAGHDLSTGERYQEVLADDPDGVLKTSAERLANSDRIVGKEPPAQDLAALSGIAAAYQKNFKSYEDFSTSIEQGGWSDKQRKKAWESGINARNTARLARTMTHRGNSTDVVRPADREFAETLADTQFQANAKQIYEAYEGETFQGTDAEASQWLAGHMRDLDFSTPMQALIVARIVGADAKTHQAYLAAFEMWESTAMEPSVMAQLGNTGRMILDPLNLIGTPVGKATVVTAGRLGIKSLLKRFAVGAAGGGAAGAVTEGARSVVTDTAVDPGRAALTVGAGAVGGGTISAAAAEAGAVGAKLIKGAKANLMKGPGAPTAGTPRSMLGQLNLGGSTRFDPETGFYSPVQRAVESVTQEKMTPQQALAAIKSAPDVRQEELGWLELDDFFKGRKSVTKQEVLDHIAKNRMLVTTRDISGQTMHLGEWMEGQSAAYAAMQRREDQINDLLGGPARDTMTATEVARLQQEYDVNFNRMRDLEIDIAGPEAVANGQTWGARHAPYTVGKYGENPASGYREHLYIHPEGAQASGAEQHFGDQPGIVMWSRTTERATPEGHNVHFIEELQSDVHQERFTAEKNWKALQEQGHAPASQSLDQLQWEKYRKMLTRHEGREPVSLPERWEDTSARQRKAMLQDTHFWNSENSSITDAAPQEVLRKSWSISALKSEIYRAVKEDSDFVAWTPAKVHQDRWGKGEWSLDAGTPLGVHVLANSRMPGGKGIQVASIMNGEPGAEMMSPANFAAKYLQPMREAGLTDQAAALEAFVASNPESGAKQVINLSKQVVIQKGGFKFYDRDLVNEANKFLKRYGGKVEQIEIDVKGKPTKVWGIRLTDKLREKILQGGVPLGMAGGVQVGAQDESN